MLNMVKFKPGTGRQEFLAYLEALAPARPPGGIDVFYSGAAYADLGEGEEWDFVGLARYASFTELADFVTSDVYQNKAIPHRENALERAVFMITQPMSLDDYFSSTPPPSPLRRDDA